MDVRIADRLDRRICARAGCEAYRARSRCGARSRILFRSSPTASALSASSGRFVSDSHILHVDRHVGLLVHRTDAGYGVFAFFPAVGLRAQRGRYRFAAHGMAGGDHLRRSAGRSAGRARACRRAGRHRPVRLFGRVVFARFFAGRDFRRRHLVENGPVRRRIRPVSVAQ